MAPGKHLKDLQNSCQDAGQKQKFEKYIDQERDPSPAREVEACWAHTTGGDVVWGPQC